MLTFLPLEEIEKMEQWQGSELNKAKEILAYELTKLVHGEEEAEKAQTASRNLFAGGGVTGDIPTTTYAKADLDEGKDILTLLVDTNLQLQEARQDVLFSRVVFLLMVKRL